MNIKLISITQPQIKIEDDSRFLTPEELIVYCARVSNPSNQLNIETAPKLINYCIKNKHWSIFEQVDFTVEIKTSRAIAAQILRHKSASFQEFCITGDSLVTTVLPSNNLPNYIPIKKLYDRQKWKNYKDLLIKVYNNSKNEFETSKMKEVFYIGKKPVYKVILSDGKYRRIR
jgi:thymidylate synthase ThyX